MNSRPAKSLPKRLKPRWQVLVLIGLALACGQARAESYVWQDKLGQKEPVQTPVNRAAIFQLYDLLPILDVWDRVVCLPYHCVNDKILMNLAPERVRRLSAGMGSGAEINMERLIRLRPDVVLSYAANQAQIGFMQRQGLKVIAVSPDSIETLYLGMDLLGRLFDKPAEIIRTKRHMNALFNLITHRVSPLKASERQRVLCLGNRPNLVMGSRCITNELIQLTGASNAATGVVERNYQVSMEQIIRWNPDVIFIQTHVNTPYSAKDLLHSPQWRTIRAVRQGRVYDMPLWSMSPQVAPVTLWMASKTYPDRFSDMNIRERIDRFYQEVYRVSAAQARCIDGL